MTVAVVVKVFDGIVVAADSATTFPLPTGAQVYNNANKIFHLHRKLPIGAMTWGLGSVNSASIATLAKDLRRRLMGMDPDHLGWELSPTSSIREVAERAVEMFHDELFVNAYPDPAHPPPSPLGLLIYGYSGGEKQAEAWEILFEDPQVRPTPEVIYDIPECGWEAFAQPEALHRLFYGVDMNWLAAIKPLIDDDAWPKVLATAAEMMRNPVLDSMPLADAVGLAEFLVRTTAGYSHFVPGPDTVGGTVEVAAISRHEGFRWISRKHYYPTELNPWGHAHDQ